MKRILVALDGSPRAPLVLAAATKLAELAQGKLVLFRAVGVPPELPLDMLAMAPHNLEAALLEDARASLLAYAARLPPTLVADKVVELGIAWDAIVREAHKQEVDLVVIGSHGYGRLDRLLGTTAAKVVNHAEQNVLVVRNAL